MPPVVLHLNGYQQRSHRNLGYLNQRFQAFWARAEYPARMITVNRRFRFVRKTQQIQAQLQPLEELRALVLPPNRWTPSTLHQWRKRVLEGVNYIRPRLAEMPGCEAALAALDDLHITSDDFGALRQAAAVINGGFHRVIWSWKWLKDQRENYHNIEVDKQPIATDHYFIAWPPNHLAPEVIAHDVQSQLLQDGLSIAPLPAMLPCDYEDGGKHLIPTEEGRPFVAVLSAYEFMGHIDLHCTHILLRLNLPMALAIDVQTLEMGKAMLRAQNAYTVLENQVAGRGKYNVKDPRSEKAFQAADYALQQLGPNTLHDVRIAVLIQGDTLRDLEKNIRTLINDTAAWLRWDRLPGTQLGWLKLFTTTATSKLNFPIVKRTNLSETLAAKVPYGYKKTTRQDGNMWGIDLDEDMAIHYDPWTMAGGSDENNAHLMMVGQSGSGKTVTFNMLGLRRAIAGDQIVFFDPVGKCEWLAEAVGQHGCKVYRVADFAATINILDPAVDVSAPDAGLRQRGQVLRKLQILLGRTQGENNNVRFFPRVFNNFEEGAIDRALADPIIYGPYGEHLATMTPATAPLLSDLIEALRSSEWDEGKLLAREIEAKLLGSQARIFNAHTTLRWDFNSHQVVCYNFFGVDSALLPLYYDLAFGAFNVYIRDKGKRRLANGKRRKVIFMIDEFKFMSSVEALRAEVANATKTWRNFNAAMWTADQNASTYFNDTYSSGSYGQDTATNALIKIFMRQEDSDARVLASAYGDSLTEQHLQTIRTAEKGTGIVVFDREVHHLEMQLSGAETAFFIRDSQEKEAT